MSEVDDLIVANSRENISKGFSHLVASTEEALLGVHQIRVCHTG